MILKVLIVLVSIYEEVVQSVEECGILNNENNPPWNVGIYKGVDSNNLELVCLGTVIKHNIVITAAHCLYDQTGTVKKEEFYVSSKTLDKYREEKDPHLQKVDKGNLYTHKAFKGDVRHGDIVIVRLGNSLESEELLPICIDWDNTRPILAEGDALRHSNWQNGVLEMTDVTYMDYEHCHYLVSQSFQAFLTSDKICAKSDKGDIDDGSGLIYLNLGNNLWYMRGIVSGHDPEKSNIFIYSDIILYLNWISNISAKLTYF